MRHRWVAAPLMRRRWIAFASGLLPTLFFLACSRPRDDAETPTPIIHPLAVRIDVVRADPWPETWEAAGFLRRSPPVTLSSRMAGVIKQVAVSKGQRVKAGDLLVGFDTADIDGNLKEADSARPTSPDALRKAAEAVEMARLNMGADGTEEARKTAQAALERALSAQAALRANTSGMEAAHKAAEAVREASLITAPVDGRIAEVSALTGRLVAKDAPLLRLEPTELHFETSVETLKLGGAQAGSALKVSVNRSCKGEAKILEISDSPLAGQKDVIASLPPCRDPTVNARGQIRFEGVAHPVVTVAAAAVITRDDRTSVFLVEDGLAKLRRITVGEKRDGRAEVIAGLAPGSKVVLNPSGELKDNTPVVPSVTNQDR